MRRIVLAVFALTLLAACQPTTTELTEEQKAEIAAEVKLLHNQSLDAWRAVDVDRALSYYRDSPEFADVLDGRLTNEFAAVEDRVRLAFANLASQTLTISDLQATVLAPNVVCVNEQGTYAETDTEGVTGPEVPYVYTAIWVRRDGEWKIDIVHQSGPTVENP